MKIIDAHMHLSHIKEFKRTAAEKSFVDYSVAGLLQEYAENGVVLGIGMGLTETQPDGFPDVEAVTPMGLDLTDELPPQFVYCLGINPFKLDETAVARLEAELQKPNVVGLKIYLGYYPFYAYDSVYDPVYALAAKYQVPVVFHTGDTYSERGLLKYSHPLTLDEVAVKHRDVHFMMAHFGDPWVLDGAEVVYKNRNMFADLSGLMVGDAANCKRLADSPLFFSHLRHAITYCDHYDKFLFGTDWPLAPVKPYIQFVQELIPAEYHEDVFYKTALKVFPKIKPLVE
ncbi:amidohydrolase family protein [Brevibacillus porteri]|uniref:Amidohydrolase n=1 Tax=Brevibacillus porteri TaxID=2126350 RepID=A0ABX5FWH8_9BACL|nr:amidohydrolase family protein [Brevibacillus porteri]MED1797754.1 amidohydrolase family protein [Brevibacillus porteri]MED2130504.1 amidohydrolase family protein [Brevibacillus porteri]MED2745253.1 amidohydrolase family protein [Brevibacillus porteri]MED2812744.1 amidohydrolase family protein [Brevibacillus porteri]MED2895282.1 amidohydrolase family protein [Brevibacillus porteri]